MTDRRRLSTRHKLHCRPSCLSCDCFRDNFLNIRSGSVHRTDEPTKASSLLYESLSDPATASSEDPEHTAFTRAFESSSTIWSYLAEPKNIARLKRFNIAMNVSANMNPTGLALKGTCLNYSPAWVIIVSVGFEWGSLQCGSVVVDVGGGFGEVATAISKTYPHLKLVVQDRPNVVDEARTVRLLFPIQLIDNLVSAMGEISQRKRR